jgi:hypothetical protein
VYPDPPLHENNFDALFCNKLPVTLPSKFKSIKMIRYINMSRFAWMQDFLDRVKGKGRGMQI